MVLDSDLVDSVRVSNGKLHVYKEKPDGEFAKIGCVTIPDDIFKLGIQAVDYEQLGLTKYMVDEEDSGGDMFDLPNVEPDQVGRVTSSNKINSESVSLYLLHTSWLNFLS